MQQPQITPLCGKQRVTTQSVFRCTPDVTNTSHESDSPDSYVILNHDVTREFLQVGIPTLLGL
jgi:hypothetical protein